MTVGSGVGLTLPGVGVGEGVSGGSGVMEGRGTLGPGEMIGTGVGVRRSGSGVAEGVGEAPIRPPPPPADWGGSAIWAARGPEAIPSSGKRKTLRNRRMFDASFPGGSKAVSCERRSV